MLPILPKHLADRACKLSLLGTVLSSGYSLYSTYGVNICLPEPWMIHLSLVVFLALTALLTELSFLICMKKPSALNMPAIQGWLQSVLGAKDFIHLMFSLLLVTSQLHLKSKIHFFVLHVHDYDIRVLLLHMFTSSDLPFFAVSALPVFCWALDHVARFLRRNFTHSSFYR
jgi:RNA polymerase primary sigma factor